MVAHPVEFLITQICCKYIKKKTKKTCAYLYALRNCMHCVHEYVRISHCVIGNDFGPEIGGKHYVWT